MRGQRSDERAAPSDLAVRDSHVAAKEPRDFNPPDYSPLEKEALAFIEADLRAAYKITKKEERYAAVDVAKAKLKEHFASQIEAGTVILDLSGVSFLDSTICRVVVSEAKRRHRAGGELVLFDNGSRATQAIELAGIDRVVRLFPTFRGALGSLLEEAPR